MATVLPHSSFGDPKCCGYLSGEWILDRQASTPDSGATAFQSGVTRIDHREPIFHFREC